MSHMVQQSCTQKADPGLANLALHQIFTDQSDHTEPIHLNFIHDSHGYKSSYTLVTILAERV